MSLTKDSDAVFTSVAYAQSIDEQVALYFYATNTPFRHATHLEFIKLCNMLRPGYTPPSEKRLAGTILDVVHKKAIEESKEILSGETVTMSLDGWSNVHNEPLICTSVIKMSGDGDGDSFLTSTIDTSEHSHTAEYLCSVAKQSIIDCQEKFNVKVRSFVTDNAANVKKMRDELTKSEKFDIIYYGCSAHILNLLAKDLQLPKVGKNVIKIIKYFRNTHLPNAWYKAYGGKQLVIPQTVRWNTMFDAMKSFLDNRGKLVQVCQDHKNEIEKDIFNLVNDVNLMVNCTDYSNILNPIAVALDEMQKDKTKIAQCVEIWFDLKEKLRGIKEVEEKISQREEMALSAAHLAANMLDHRYCGKKLTDKQKQCAFDFLRSTDKELLPLAMSFLAKKSPFPNFMFEEDFMGVEPLIWWANINLQQPLKEKMSNLANQLFSASPTTAPLERIFSSFGLVQSKLRNRLGTEKADKLTFLLKFLNKNK